MRFHWYSKLGGREVLLGESESKEKGELALNTEQKTRKFNGSCNICGKKGHMAKDCWHNKNNGNEKTDGGGKSKWSRFKGKCNHCGKVGHKEANCWEKFPDKKPEKFKRENSEEVGALFCGSVNTRRVILKTPNTKTGWGIWVLRAI